MGRCDHGTQGNGRIDGSSCFADPGLGGGFGVGRNMARAICSRCDTGGSVVSKKHTQVILSENIVQFADVQRRSQSSTSVKPTTTVSGDKWDLDEAPPDRKVAAIYKRATLASGLGRKMLPDGTMTIEPVKQPDFTELDRCLGELSDLGVDPVGLAAGGSDETLPDPAPSPTQIAC
jgi:hypothetical protein